MKVVAFLLAEVADTALLAVRGKPLLWHAVQRLRASGCVDLIAILTRPQVQARYQSAVSEFSRHAVMFLPPNGESTLSRRNTFAGCEEILNDDYDAALVHEVECAFAPPELIRDVVASIRSGASVAVPVLPVTDTIKSISAEGAVNGTLDRDALCMPQSPRGFAVSAFRRAIENDTLFAWPDPVHPVTGDPLARPIRTSFDITAIEAMLARDTRLEI